MSLFQRSVHPVLPNRDYLSVAMPTVGVEVLQVLTKDGGALRRFSQLTTVLVVPEGTTEPTVARDQTVVGAEGKVTRSTKVGLGLSIVGAFVEALGGTAPGATLSVAEARAVEFGFTDVTEDTVDLGTLDIWLATADFDPRSAAIADLLAAEQLYVVVGALKAKGVAVTVLDEQSRGLSLDVPEVAAAVGGDIEVQAGTGGSTTMTLRGSQALTIGAKVAQIKFDEPGFWVSERVLSKGEVRTFGSPAEITYLAEYGGLRFAG